MISIASTTIPCGSLVGGTFEPFAVCLFELTTEKLEILIITLKNVLL